jgi:uncharacterized protein YggE
MLALDTAVPTVTVRGDGLVRAEPDEAVLWITLSALKDGPGEALADVSARTSALVGLLDDVGVSKGDRSTTGITVGEEFEHTEKGRHSLGHRASSGVSVRLTDPELIGRLVAEAAQDLDARVDGPRWLISLDNPLRLEAARRAAADARRKAEAYCVGVGAKIGRLIELGEPGQHQAHNVGFAAAALAARYHEPMPVEQGEHELTASVWATFELELS